jgi:hypothetical protein
VIYSSPNGNTFNMSQRLSFYCLCLLLVAALVVPQNVFSSTQSRLIYGSVISAISGRPIAGAAVTVNNCATSQSTATGSDGSWQLNFPEGTYGTLSFAAPGYRTQTYELTYNANLVYAGGIVSLTPL